ncbi:MAG: pilus assembly protein PilP [Rhodoferax sp.]
MSGFPQWVVRWRGWSVWLLVAGSLGGCGSSRDQDVQQWISDERNRTQPKVAPIPAPKQFVPAQYASTDALEPFSSQKLAQAFKRDSAQTTASVTLVAPELQRRKEPLEAYPLDAVTMVGSLLSKGQPIALVRVDNLLYQVRVGAYLGQNYGKVTKITETEITLREIVQDAVGEWVERSTALQLQEVTK